MEEEEEVKRREERQKKEDGRREVAERVRSKIKEKEERIRRGRERGEKEKKRREEEERRKRERNVIWREIEGKDLEERRYMVKGIMRKALSRIAGIRGLEERKGEAGRWVIISELEEIADKEEILEKGVMIGRLWE